MYCSELVLLVVLRSAVVSVLGNCAADPRSSPRLCFLFNHEVLNHVEDHVFNLISVFFDRDEMLLLT
jgi:hypothetical protein